MELKALHGFVVRHAARHGLAVPERRYTPSSGPEPSATSGPAP